MTRGLCVPPSAFLYEICCSFLLLQIDLVILRGVVTVWRAPVKLNACFRLLFDFLGPLRCVPLSPFDFLGPLRCVPLSPCWLERRSFKVDYVIVLCGLGIFLLIVIVHIQYTLDAIASTCSSEVC